MEKQPAEKPPEPKPQKSAQKTARNAKIGIWLCIGGIVYFILGIKFLQRLINSNSTALYDNFKPLIWGIFGIFICVESIGFIFGIVGSAQLWDSKSRLQGLKYCVYILALLFITLLVFAPSSLAIMARTKQFEANQNLSAIYSAYQSYHSDHHTYPSSPSIQVGNTAYNCFSITGWEPKGALRYNYNCMNIEAFSGNWVNFPCPSGIITNANKNSFTIASCGNMDADSTVDVWTIDDAKHLKNVIDDVKE